jgi:hypothetical protein
MDTMPSNQQRYSMHLSAPVFAVEVVAPSAANFAVMANTDAYDANPTHTTWLGGVDEIGCFSDTIVSKRITPGHLERFLT